MIGQYDWRRRPPEPEGQYINTPIGRLVVWQDGDSFYASIGDAFPSGIDAKDWDEAYDKALDFVRTQIAETRDVLKKIAKQNAWWRKSREPKKEQDFSGAHF